MDGEGFNSHRSVEDVFKDFKGRRTGLLKALTIDTDDLYQKCDPEKENLCLYGMPNGTWEVALPCEEVPPELPEPALGINFARDGLQEKEWLSMIAVHSDTWLLSVSFYFGARFGFDHVDRERLFSMINGFPTLYEIVTGKVKPEKEEKPINKSKSSIKRETKPDELLYAKEEKVESEEDEEHDSDALCGACGLNYGSSADEFWILCDVCEVWFHGDCVRMNAARAASIKKYKCPSCAPTNKKSRP